MLVTGVVLAAVVVVVLGARVLSTIDIFSSSDCFLDNKLAIIASSPSVCVFV
jgi:hypothetical protein